MKKLLILLFLIFVPLSPPSFSKELEKSQYPLTCCTEMKGILEKIQELAEVNSLIESIRAEGPLRIKINHPKVKKYFDGCWNTTNRTIYITYKKNSPEGLLLSTLLFELHNAKRTGEIALLDKKAIQGRLSKKEYVRAVELLEFENVHATTKLIRKGQHQGIFPTQCYWDYPNNFENHLKAQASSGHSQWIANSYDELRG